MTIIVRITISSIDVVRLTVTNMTLLIIGVISLSMALTISVILIVLLLSQLNKKLGKFTYFSVKLSLGLESECIVSLGFRLSLVLLVVGGVLVVVSLVLWVAAAFQVGLQDSKQA